MFNTNTYGVFSERVLVELRHLNRPTASGLDILKLVFLFMVAICSKNAYSCYNYNTSNNSDHHFVTCHTHFFTFVIILEQIKIIILNYLICKYNIFLLFALGLNTN